MLAKVPHGQMLFNKLGCCIRTPGLLHSSQVIPFEVHILNHGVPHKKIIDDNILF